MVAGVAEAAGEEAGIRAGRLRDQSSGSGRLSFFLAFPAQIGNERCKLCCFILFILFCEIGCDCVICLDLLV